MANPPTDLLNWIATEAEIIGRALGLGNKPTAGPPIEDHPPVVGPGVQDAPEWVDGWWSGAKKTPAHPGRMGGAIHPWSTVVHTTDMLPAEWAALVTAWTTKPADGACAHFLIGRTPELGVIQLVPVNRNGNHAGGPGHGVYKTAVDSNIHPNLVAVGIEVHCAGGVVKLAGLWRLVEDGKAHGDAIPDADVVPDPQRPGRGWHVATPYQMERLMALLTALEQVLAPMPGGALTQAFGEVPPAYACIPTARIATHAELDPVHRADPWPVISTELRKRALAK